MDDLFLQKLLAASEPEEKAAFIAEALFNTLPAKVALVARQCSLFHWFDQRIVEALLKNIPLNEGELSDIYDQIRSFPFVETLPWGSAYNDLTRDGLLHRYIVTQPELLKAAAQLAAPAYKVQRENTKIVAEAFFCHIVAGEAALASELFNELEQKAKKRRDQEYIEGLKKLLQEAQGFPFVSILSFQKSFSLGNFGKDQNTTLISPPPFIIRPSTSSTHISGQNLTIGAMTTGDNSSATVYGNPREESQTGPLRPKEMINVLFALSNPRGTDSLRLNTEMRAIQESLRLSQQRERIRSRVLPAATSDDLRRALLDEPYQIVHLAGHGAPYGFVLEDEQGRPHMVSQEALAQHFANYRQTLRCVILNACYTLAIGQSISLGIPYVIAMSGPIHDQAAIAFSHGFYDAIGAGTDIERAYREGLSAVRFAGLDRDFLALLSE